MAGCSRREALQASGIGFGLMAILDALAETLSVLETRSA
jgi:hypothetical protein